MNTTHKKIGSLSAFSMMVASVVGIGIFLKNSTVFKQVGFNPYSSIISWSIAAIACLFLSISYADISTTSKSRAGISKWAEKVSGYKLAFFIKTNYTFFYFGLLMVGLAYYAAELVMKNLEVFFPQIMSDGFGTYSSIGLTLSIGTIIMILFVLFNYFSLKISGGFQVISLFLKFIPLLAVAIFGVIFVINTNDLSLFNKLSTNSTYVSTQAASPSNIAPISFNNIIIALPGILFAFDSFLGVGSLAPDIKKSERRMPFIFIIGMLSIAFIYISVTFGQIFVGEGISWNSFKKDILKKMGVTDDATAQKIADIVTKVFYGLIFFSILGVVNGFSAAAINVFANQVDHGEIFGSNRLLKWAKGNSKLAGMYLIFLIGLFWSIPYWLLSFIYNTDVFIDGLTNFPTLFFFLIYGLIPLLQTIQKIKYRFKFSFKNLFYGFCSLISFLLCSFIVFYQIGYFFLWKALVNFGQKDTSGWGGFLDITTSYEIKAEVIAIISFTLIFVFLFSPLLNRLLIDYRVWSKNKKFYNLEMVRSDVAELSLISRKQQIIDELNRYYPVERNTINHDQSDVLVQLLQQERAKRIKREKYLIKTQKKHLDSIYNPEIFR